MYRMLTLSTRHDIHYKKICEDANTSFREVGRCEGNRTSIIVGKVLPPLSVPVLVVEVGFDNVGAIATRFTVLAAL